MSLTIKTRKNSGYGLSQRMVPLDVRKGVGEDGEFEGYASVFDVVDSYGTMMKRGCFVDSVREKGLKKIKLLAQHNSNEILGQWLEMTEDDKGLKVRGQLFMEDPQAKRYALWMNKGVLDGISVGFRTVKSSRIEDEEDGSVHWELLKLDLWEASLVTFPANELATVRSDYTNDDFGRNTLSGHRTDERAGAWRHVGRRAGICP